MVSNNLSEGTTTSPNTQVAKWTKGAIFIFLSTKFCSREQLSSKSRIRQTPEFSKSYIRFLKTISIGFIFTTLRQRQSFLNSNNKRFKLTETQLSISYNYHLPSTQHHWKLNSSSFNKTANLYDKGRRPIKWLKNEGGAVSSSVSTTNSCYRGHMAELRATLNYVPGSSTTLKFKALKMKSSFWCSETVHFCSVQCISFESIPKIYGLIIVVKAILRLIEIKD
jgi:hypothetical protein